MTGAAKGTVLKLLSDLGAACDGYQDRAMRNLKTKRVQCDEIWAFCYAKDKNVPKLKQGEPGVRLRLDLDRHRRRLEADPDLVRRSP